MAKCGTCSFVSLAPHLHFQLVLFRKEGDENLQGLDAGTKACGSHKRRDIVAHNLFSRDEGGLRMAYARRSQQSSRAQPNEEKERKLEAGWEKKKLHTQKRTTQRVWDEEKLRKRKLLHCWCWWMQILKSKYVIFSCFKFKFFLVNLQHLLISTNLF